MIEFGTHGDIPDMPISRRKTAAAYSQVRFLQDLRSENPERCVGSVEPGRAPEEIELRTPGPPPGEDLDWGY